MPLGGIPKGIRSCSIRNLPDEPFASPGRQSEQRGAKQHDRSRFGHGTALGSAAAADNAGRRAYTPCFESRGIILRAAARCGAGCAGDFVFGSRLLFLEDAEFAVEIDKASTGEQRIGDIEKHVGLAAAAALQKIVQVHAVTRTGVIHQGVARAGKQRCASERCAFGSVTTQEVSGGTVVNHYTVEGQQRIAGLCINIQLEAAILLARDATWNETGIAVV